MTPPTLLRLALAVLALGAGWAPDAAARQVRLTERAPTTAPTIMSDATPPAGVTVSSIPAGIAVSWQPVAGAVGYTLCRESPPGSATCTGLTASPVPATTHFDTGLPPGGTYAYRVTAWRADQHHGTAAPVTGRAGDVPPPVNFRILEDRSLAAPAELVLGWDAPSYVSASGQPVKVGSFRLLGSGLSTAQAVNSTTQRVALGSGDHQWQVTAMLPNPAGGWFESAAPATLEFKAPGKYRLVALGFQVQQQSPDDLLDKDGRGNEVYVAAAVTVTTRTLALPQVNTVRGASYGDVGNSGKAFPRRYQAGSASRGGGLATGDIVPIGLNLGAPTGAVSPAAFPVILWEGRLNEQGMVVVHPTLWEEDLDQTAYNQWVGKVTASAQAGYGPWRADLAVITSLRDGSGLGPGTGDPIVRCQDDIIYLMDPGDCPAHGQDRPLGLAPHFSKAQWHDRVVVLTQASI
ncbi:MAG TPA: fibronectin type III domain-containing protein, partial [Gemmatimonadales bacterium]|nr:fibronectin type III domain-containing protein [Gemmatimonadales bacterium]